MIRRLTYCFESPSNQVGRRFCGLVASEMQLMSNRTKKKRKPRPIVEKKKPLKINLSGDCSPVKVVEVPFLLKMFEHQRAEPLTAVVNIKNKIMEGNTELVEQLEQIEHLEKKTLRSKMKKLMPVAARHREELNEKIIAKLRKENELLVVYARRLIKNYLHACVNSGDVDKAYHTLIFHRHHFGTGHVNPKHNIVDVSLYNVILKGYALTGQLNRVHELFRVMKNSKVVPNMQSYAYHLLCLVKQCEVNDDDIQKVLQDISAASLSVSRLLIDSCLNANYRSLLKEHLSRVDPSLKFEVPNFEDTSHCKLMKSFNSEPRTAYQPIDDMESYDFCRQLQEQIDLEVKGFTKIKAVYDEDVKSDPETIELYRSKWKSCEELWRTTFTEAFDNAVKALKHKHKNNYGMDILPFLTVMDQREYVDVLIREIYNLAQSANFSPPMYHICSTLGAKVMKRYMTLMRFQNCPEIKALIEECVNYYKDSDLIANYSPRQFLYSLFAEKGLYLNSDISDMEWSKPAIVGVGRFLYNILLRESKFDVNVLKPNSRNGKLVNAFYEVYVTDKETNKTVQEIRCTSNFSKFFQLSHLTDLYFDANELPMLVPPFPWISHKQGGYLYSKTDYIREAGTDEQGLLAINLAEKANLSVVHDALNVLSFCAWKINEDVLDVVIEVFRNKGNEKLDIPLHQSTLPSLPAINDAEGLSEEDRKSFFRKRYQLKKERAEMFSQWCDSHYKLSIANHFRHKVFWFPQNLDFRGRVYSVPPHFNHLGDDLSRSILKFAKGKPLGPDGLNWLKIHLINLTGTKKRSTNQERLEYANEIMRLILDSAKNPLDTNWWMKSDEPWQTLACCMEIAKALKSPNPEEYICHFPVHQDGSCNGLQHYAALGRDVDGAISVNLAPDERPNDVYATVAAEVDMLRTVDADDRRSQNMLIAQVLSGFINRKVVKQTVMTYVYGVTSYGARLQILKRLRENESFPQQYSSQGAKYLTKKVFEAIGNMFTSTQKIQHWFTDCASMLSRIVLAPVEWVTPLGFPVVQPYFKISTTSAIDCKNSEVYSVKKEVKNWRPNLMKQKNAFPPNFIHSLDSSHMMLTALHCERKGIAFAAVHDSYWTHPSTIDEMNKICRQQFVALHSEPILTDLSQSMVNKYEPILRRIFRDDPENYHKNLHILKAVPETGSFELQEVLKSVYFFS